MVYCLSFLYALYRYYFNITSIEFAWSGLSLKKTYNNEKMWHSFSHHFKLIYHKPKLIFHWFLISGLNKHFNFEGLTESFRYNLQVLHDILVIVRLPDNLIDMRSHYSDSNILSSEQDIGVYTYGLKCPK